jgi:hypothetical protein
VLPLACDKSVAVFALGSAECRRVATFGGQAFRVAMAGTVVLPNLFIWKQFAALIKKTYFKVGQSLWL